MLGSFESLSMFLPHPSCKYGFVAFEKLRGRLDIVGFDDVHNQFVLALHKSQPQEAVIVAPQLVSLCGLTLLWDPCDPCREQKLK